MASVSGIRGIVGETLTPGVAADAGSALATYLGRGPIVVGRDSRVSGEMIRTAVVSGVLACGCDVIDIGVCGTPTTALMVAARQAAGGIMLTASHNPSPWNGIKFIGPDAVAPPRPVAEKILDVFHRRQFKFASADDVGHVSVDGSADERHVEAVLRTVNGEAIRECCFKVVLDSVNGAGGPAGRRLLEALGCQVVHINAEPTGRFAHPPEVYQSLRQLVPRLRLSDLCGVVSNHLVPAAAARAERFLLRSKQRR